MQKLHAGSRVQAATIGERAGLLAAPGKKSTDEPDDH
jgi:hypothetical protein